MLSITDISVRIAGRLLIDHSSAQIVPGARVGFVGRNGVGKSTLFHAIRGELPTETGTIAIPPRWRVNHFQPNTMDFLEVSRSPQTANDFISVCPAPLPRSTMRARSNGYDGREKKSGRSTPAGMVGSSSRPRP